MFKIDGKSMLMQLVDLSLDRKSFEYDDKRRLSIKPCVIIPITLVARNKNKRIHVDLNTLFFGSTSVLYAEIKHPYVNIQDMIWRNTSNHDSCWRSDGLHFIDDYYFRLCATVAPKSRPVDVDTEMRFGFTSLQIIKKFVFYKFEDNILNISEIR